MSEPTVSARGRVSGASGPRAIISISRQYGARGAAVAKAVAERLGYACWDRDLVGAIASQVRVDPALIAPFDEQRRGVDDGNHPARPGFADYVRGLEQVARMLARRGSAVVVGRGVGFLVDPDACLRVRVVCPLDQRIASVVERSQLCTESARATIEYVDGQRQAFTREVHGIDIDDPTNFDLLVSTGALTVTAAADVIISAYRARFDVRRWPRPSEAFRAARAT